MQTFQKLLALFLITLFVSLSFNAYACLVPIYSGMQVSQGSDCTKPGEEPASQFCDGFKSLALQSNSDIPSEELSHVVPVGHVPSPFPYAVTFSQFPIISGQGQSVPPRDTLVLISVFRI
mgnify:CR=1 FL=1